MNHIDDDDTTRQEEEWEALFAFYGNQVTKVVPSTAGAIIRRNTTLPSITTNPPPPTTTTGTTIGPYETWQIQLDSSTILELQLPPGYPSREAPIPRIMAPSFLFAKDHLRTIEKELQTTMWSEETQVAILWAEHVRETLQLPDTEITTEGETLGGIRTESSPTHEYEVQSTLTSHSYPLSQGHMDATDQYPDSTTNVSAPSNNSSVCTFHPYSSRFGQPIRHFDSQVIHNPTNRREIYTGRPFHPPKSGPSETLVAHVAAVHSMDHVQWVLAHLLLNDKKVARATHNMIAYRFWDDSKNCFVSDNDDDGEKGAGSKLAALLEMADVRDAIVVVSRWFGGILLGSSRFKWIASTARDALEEAGFIPTK